MQLSENTQATLLLCGTFGRNTGDVPPLTLAQYNELMDALKSLNATPGDLLHDADLIAEVCSVPLMNTRIKEADKPTIERVRKLLNRGFALSLSLDMWAKVGGGVLGRSDAAYPERMKSYLGRQAPALLYWVGNPTLFNGGGMAFVGSRDINSDAEFAIRKVVRKCVDAGMVIVSGGARGADQTAMCEAFDCGGKVIGALAGNLYQACIDKNNRAALASGNALLFSAFDPKFGFSVANAMERNKHIYAMADYAFVAQADIKGGTWEGATGELKRKNHHPVFVYSPRELPEGNRELIKRGGIAWSPSADFGSMLYASGRGDKKMEQGEFDFSLRAEYSEIPKRNLLVVRESPETHGAPIGKNLWEIGIDLIEESLKNGPLKERDLRKKIDPNKDLSLKGWCRWLESALNAGRIQKIEHTGRRGKPCVFYGIVTPQKQSEDVLPLGLVAESDAD